MQDLSCSCALYCAFGHFGNTGENIKRMQGLPKTFCDLDEVMRRYGQSNDNCCKQGLYALKGKVGFGA